ncbi:hypothetical protein PENTCL1PPCAC_10210, partial [Pristionchus entomophagus]
VVEAHVSRSLKPHSVVHSRVWQSFEGFEKLVRGDFSVVLLSEDVLHLLPHLIVSVENSLLHWQSFLRPSKGTH